MQYLRYWPAVVGFVVGTLISLWFQGPDPDAIERGMSLACAFVGAVTGLAVAQASIPARRIIALAGGFALCVLIGLAMIAYRWIFR